MSHHHGGGHHLFDDDWCSVITQTILELFCRNVDYLCSCNDTDRTSPTQPEQGTRPRRRIVENPSETARLIVT